MSESEKISLWQRPIASLDGVGAKLSEKLEALVGGKTLFDLVCHWPVRWTDRGVQPSIELARFGEIQTIRGVVQHFDTAPRGSKVQKIRLVDETGFLTLVFFNARSDYLRRQYPVGEAMVVSGHVEDFHGQKQMTHPDYAVTSDKAHLIPSVEPVYHLTAGITNRRLHGFIHQALNRLPDLQEWLQSDLLMREHWPGFKEALSSIHLPDEIDMEQFGRSRKRLAYDECFARSLTFRSIRQATTQTDAPRLSVSDEEFDKLKESFPYPLTGAQIRASGEIRSDMSQISAMQRMLQGDVGSGKTSVAAIAAFVAAKSGYQVAVMAPTEVLARQLFAGLNELLTPLGVKCECLSGRDKGKKRTAILDRLATGEIEVMCGTHALFQDQVEFQKLGLVVIDEQHRFGVNDRAKLTTKAVMPHLLIMSATPIPRSLAMTVFGDVDLSILDEKPPGRKPVDTRALPFSRLEEVMSGVIRAVERGEQIFWVCPTVDSEDDNNSAILRHSMLSELLPGKAGLVHGRLQASEKDEALELFRTGKHQVLVATTVIEVGVDVPNATVMVIEGAERFGLAQLHQLRGRVGRGSKPSYCLLLFNPPLGETAKKRLNILRDSQDGFEIAEMDFKLRGPGDILGLAQSGLPDFRFVDLTQDQNLLDISRRHADYEFEKGGGFDPKLVSLLSLLGQSDIIRPQA
ncbi:MAG: ATP-dependent DNA helicase RecG [Ponticaulis sp.]|nr:ATP-dependent DNA helicase RecG [Ponticaulis sp.]